MKILNEKVYSAGLDAAIAGIVGADALAGKRILITGATGMIGSFMADVLVRLNALRGAGIAVYAAGRSETGMRRRFAAELDKGCIHYVPYDATRPVCLDFEPDYIVHAATSAHPLAYSTDPVGTMQANLLGILNLLEVLKAQGHGRVLMLSTGEIYGENPELPEGFSEEDHGWVDPMRARACYPESKRASETLCASYHAQYGVDALVARLCHIYGPTFTDSNSRADAQFIRKALAGEDIVMKSAGSQVRSYCHVSDATAALLTLLSRGEAGQACNVANRNSVASIREYAQTLADIAGVHLTFEMPPEAEKAGYTRVTRAVLNPAKLEGMGWKAHYTLQEGLKQTYECFR